MIMSYKSSSRPTTTRKTNLEKQKDNENLINSLLLLHQNFDAFERVCKMAGAKLCCEDATYAGARGKIEWLHRSKFISWAILIPCVSISFVILISFSVDLRISRFSRKPSSHRSPPVTYYPSDEDGDTMETENHSGFLRLPQTVLPSYYDLTLTPWMDSDQPYIEGTVKIFVTCVTSTNQITLHSRNLSITSETVSEVSDQMDSGSRNLTEIPIQKTKVQEIQQFYVIYLKENLKPSRNYELKLIFRSSMQTDLTGFYRSEYFDRSSNSTKFVAVTQFEPTAARKVFPCFDEPQMKAIFQVTIGRKLEMRSISNAPLLRTRSHVNLTDWVWDEYEPTLPMSTYLLAFVVSEFPYRETFFGDKVKGQQKILRVWSRPDVLNQTDYVLRIGPKLLEFFQDYFLDVEYPLTKLDIVAVPEFQNGGMEDWGLIIFRETELLFDPDVTSNSVQNTIASTITHEISHQWFGNLVTPRWWSDLWLNEGFASYFEYVGVNYVEPSWHKMELLVVDEMEFVFDTDVLDLTRPISIPVEDPDDIEEQFDAISYSKGAAIITMVNAFLTMDTFRQGLHNYLMKWKYNNTIPTDLWHQFTLQAHKDSRLPPDITVGDIMASWTLQRGFPVIQVTRNYDLQTAQFTQSKYTLNKTQKKGHGWWIPVTMASPRQQNSTPFWLAPSDTTLETDIGAEEYDWLVVNLNATGYYRVNYDMRNWQMLSNQLKSDPKLIPVLNRAQLLDDCLSFGRTSRLSYAFVLTLVEYLYVGEEDFVPWEAFLNGLQHIDNMLKLTPVYHNFQSYVLRMIGRQYGKIEFNRTSNTERLGFLNSLHEQLLMLWATSANHPDALRRAQVYFNESVSTVPANFRKPMYCAMIEHGGESEWNFFWDRYINGNNSSPSEIKTLIQALACSTNLTTLKRLLEMAMTSDSDIDDDHDLLVVKEVAINPLGTSLVFKLLDTNWPEVQKRIGDLSVVISVIGDQHNSPEQLKQWLLFKTKYGSDLGASQRSVYQTIEKVRSNIAWMEVNYHSLNYLFKQYS